MMLKMMINQEISMIVDPINDSKSHNMMLYFIKIILYTKTNDF